MHHKRNNIALFYTDSIHKIQKSPVRENKGFFFAPTPTSQQANRSTSQRVFVGLMRPKSLGQFGSVWVRRGRLMELKHRFNPPNPINTHFLTNIITPPSLTDFSKKSSHRFNRFNKTNRNGMSLVAPPIDLQTYYSLTCWLVDSLTFKKNRCKNPQQP